MRDIDDYGDARVAVKNAMLSGYPGYFCAVGDGDYIRAMDTAWGLPVRLIGDDITSIDEARVAGHNAGLIEFIEEHGVPWNSRLPWIKEILDPAAFFADCLKLAEPIRLTPGGSPAVSPDGATVIELGEMGEEVLEEMLNVTSTKFFLRPEPADLAKALEIGRRDGDQAQRERGDLDLSSSSPMTRGYPRCVGLSDYARFKSVAVKPPLRWPVLGQAWTEQPITLEIWLQWYEGAEQVDLFWGPEGSELAFFRFENVQNLVMPPAPEMFAVLDLLVGEWLGTDSFDMRRRRLVK